MNVRKPIKLLLPVFCFMACTGKKPTTDTGNIDTVNTIVPATTIVHDTFAPGKVIAQVFCKNDAAQSYSLYIPVKGNNEALPVIYFFDPHADGALPLNKYKALADKYNFILVGSNNSKNGNDWPTAENIWRSLFDDTQKRLEINSNRIYACGFSGGAKVAGHIALNYSEVKAVIANGAGLPDETPPGNFNFTFTAIAGEGDMNMTDLVAFSSELDKTKTKHRILLFDGKHEWAPESTMNIAFAGLQLDAMRGKIIPADNIFINDFIAKSKQQINAYTAANKLVKAEQECKLSLSMLDGLTTERTWFKEKDASVTNNPAYKKQWQTERNLFTTEQNIKAGYMQQFQGGGMSYWSKTINDLQTKAKGTSAEAAMYQRLLAYLSLAFYSISNRLIASNQNNDAQHFVELYKMADATNSEAWYFSAILNARSNNVKATKDDLLKAVDLGFNDKNRMIQQPEFMNLAAQINFAMLESKMKK
ncbi:hypothetical protein FRZ67_22605 [Panacibacter ginsenosidivorans]|uniref:Alpha/beta hydrolase n=1 Tax=Panacibacter ginsenosidivorans TaxID=1813871 RepID=A0A5B8VET9_9BACT|nr:hypothetical protein [Panacibacter ginsenosidivorans]QEC69950.1 hypothetical protein FRZ67_22605 [Panacibacter ginsenosidivorans]